MANTYINKVVLGSEVLIDLSSDTVSASKLLSGTSAHSAAGEPITGSIPSRSSSDVSVSGLTVSIPSGYYSASQSETVSDANLVAGNIKKDVTIFGVTGTFEGMTDYKVVVSTGLAFLSKASVNSSTKLSVTGTSVSGTKFIVP